MDKCLVRPMRLGDIDQVLAIERSTFELPWSRDSFVAEITENKCARYLCAEMEGRVLAYGGMWLVIDEGHITNIAVREDARGRGFGEKITRALIQLAADNGIVSLTLEVRESNLVARSLYLKLGFADVGIRKGYYDSPCEDAMLMTLSPLPDERPAEIAAFWRAFLEHTGRPSDTRYVEAFHFGAIEASSARLLALTLSGEKRATCSSLPAYEKVFGFVPKAGDLSIVTDFFGHPRCVIETTRVEVRPFRDISWEMARREGEDESLEGWRENHIEFFTLEGKQLGYAFDWDMRVIFEDFTVVFV